MEDEAPYPNQISLIVEELLDNIKISRSNDDSNKGSLKAARQN